MAKYKPSNENQMVMLPISLQDQLVPGTLEHTINRLVDENINLSVFDERYKNDETGAAAIHPKILLKVILLAYAKGMISSRQIERACHENIIFIALSYGYAPDHSTIAAFKKRFLPSSATYSWCVKNCNCWAARTSAWMG
jgi:transposase